MKMALQTLRFKRLTMKFILVLLHRICTASDEECINPRFQNNLISARSDEERLLNDLLCNYDKETRPVKQFSDVLVVTFELKLIQVVSVSEKEQKMQTNVWITKTWKNPQLTWNSSEYNGIKNINLDSHNIWTPTIILYNNADEAFSGGPLKYKTKIILDDNGKNTWFAAVSFKSSCKFNVRNFPFDEQECLLTFGSWAYTYEKMKILPAKSKGDTSDYIENGEWEIVSIPVEAINRKYKCCKKPFTEITYKFRMRRKALYYLFNLILPCTIISTLAVLAFCINPKSGQRITLSITVMLAMSVFLNFAWSRLPVTSDSVPLLAKYYMVTMTVIGLSLFANCVTLNYFYRDDALSYAPKFCRINFLARLAKLIASLFCMQSPSSKNRSSRKMMHCITKKNATGRNDDGETRRASDYDSVVMIAGAICEKKIKLHPQVKSRNLARRQKKKSRDVFSKEILETTSTHALVAEAKEYYENYKEFRKEREEDDVDVLMGHNIEQAFLNDVEDDKQFTAMILDRFFLIIFSFAFVLSMTALLSGDTSKYTQE